MKYGTKLKVIKYFETDDFGYKIRVETGKILYVERNGLYDEKGNYVTMLKYAKPKINVEVILSKEEQEEADFNNRIERFLLSPRGQAIINERAEKIEDFRIKKEKKEKAYREEISLKRDDEKETKEWSLTTSFGEGTYSQEANRILKLIDR
jgi:hypothetical protein